MAKKKSKSKKRAISKKDNKPSRYISTYSPDYLGALSIVYPPGTTYGEAKALEAKVKEPSDNINLFDVVAAVVAVSMLVAVVRVVV